LTLSKNTPRGNYFRLCGNLSFQSILAFELLTESTMRGNFSNCRAW